MHYVYVLQSLKDHRTYVGSTNNMQRRFDEHNAGHSRSTKHRAPFIILFIEELKSSPEAKRREQWWKRGAGRKKLKEYFAKRHSELDERQY